MDTAIPPHEQLRSYGRYTYTPLPSDGRYIRLIRLLPDANPQAPIQCKLFDYPLQRLNDNHLYEALSYVWGDPKETIPIKVNGLYLQITTNLYTALVELRNAILDRVLWVDAICIDQMNVYERANQVQLMTEIYASASQVVIWLGEEEDQSSRICSLIRLVAETSSIDGKRMCEQCESWKTWNEDCPSCGDPENGRGLLSRSYDVFDGKEEVVVREVRRLLHLPWFTRIWVLQEAAAARHVLIMLGRQRLNGSIFSHGIHILAAYINGLIEGEGLPNPVVLSLVGAAEFRPQEIKKSPTTFRLGIADLAELVNMFHTNRATDPRDKIYALLGMLKGTEMYHQLTPDYNVEWEELFERLIRTLLGKKIQVATEKQSEKAIIKGLGFMLGTVISIESPQNGNRKFYMRCEMMSGRTSRIMWQTRSPARAVKYDDIICLLCGADYPCVVRPHRDYFDIIMVISSTPEPHSLVGFSSDTTYVPWYSWSLSENMPMRNFLLSWDWSATRVSPFVPEMQPIHMPFLPQSGAFHIAGTSASVIDQVARLRDTVLIKEQAELIDQVKWSVNLAQDLLRQPSLNSDQIFRDLAIIYPQNDPKSDYYQLIWRRITWRLHDEIRNHIAKDNLEHLLAKDFLEIFPKPGMSDVLAFICDHAEHCLEKLDRESPENLLLLFLLRGDVLPLTDDVIGLIIFNPDAIEIFEIIDKTWNRDYKIRVSRDMIRWIAHENETKLLKLLVQKSRDQIKILIRTTDMSIVIAVADSIRGSDLLAILTEEFDGDNLKALNRETLQEAVETYHKAWSLDVKAVRQLVVDDINLNIFDGDYETIILKASRENREDIVRILIDTGKVDLNVHDTYGRMPIYYAIETGSIALCKILLEHGANPVIEDDNDITPMEKAQIFSRATRNPDFGQDFVRQCQKISEPSALVYVGQALSLNRRRMERLGFSRDRYNY